MKTYISIISLVLAASCYLPRALASETNATYLRILQASNNIQTVVSALPDIEKLWPQDPDTYLKTVNQASHILGGSADNVNAKQALLNLFERVMQKSCPTNAAQATSWVESKHDIILFYLNFGEVKNDKQRWVEIAKFIGEIRSKIIPDYKPKGMLLNGFGFTSQEIAQNQENIAEDNLQTTFNLMNNSLTFFLLHIPPNFSSTNPANADFIKQISDAAHLTDKEIIKLKGGGF